MDDETKILILPLPESKRHVKIADTFYQLSTIQSLKSRSDEVEKALIVEKDVVKRFEDKTQEEIEQDQIRKRKQQFGKLVRFRTYQFGGIAVLAFGYLFVYRRFLHPKSITNSVIYN